MKTHYPTIITIGRFAKRVMRTLKNILSSCNGMMFNTIMKLTLMTTLLAVLTTARSPRRINPERRNDTILIIGNGLSTRYLAHLGFDKIPKNVDTFGMGAVHRYYSDIGWWPTYYALCDVKVVFHNQKELKALIEDPRIPVRKYFLPLRLSDNEKLETVPHSSTGSFCMRKAIELGYKRIFIIGIETDYMEHIKESRVLTPEEIEQTGLGQLEEFKNLPANSRCILMVTKTPLVNTNYFFDSYQREGDIYSLPSGAAHYRQFHEIARLAESSKVEIINLSHTSPLTMFPKASLGDFLNAKTHHSLPVTKLFDTADRNSRKVSNGAMKGSFFRRFSDYCARNFPVAVTLGRFGKWGLTILKNTFFGIGGIALIIIAGLYIAGALTEPFRWYLVGTASALLLLSVGLLALSYARLWLNRFTRNQGRQVSDIRRQVSDIRRQVSDIKKQVSDMRRTLGAAETTLAKMNVGNFALFQQFNRRLTKQDLKHFAEEWAPKLGLSLDSRALAYIAHRICLAEDTCVGRLAGNIETMLLRVMVARSVKEPDLEVLEIGTLFGVGVAMIHENCRGFFNNLHVTIIDPLNGFYDKGQMDIMTQMPVTYEIFIHNMQRMNIPKADYTIIEKLSTEDEAIEQASKKCYNLLIIDGDHSYIGTKHDFYNYRHLVKRGGYIVFDDYNNPRWPEVKDFVDKEVVGLPELEFIGVDINIAVFRVIAPQDLTKQGRKQRK